MRTALVLLLVSGALLAPTASAGGGIAGQACDVEQEVTGANDACAVIDPYLLMCVAELVFGNDPPTCENRVVEVATEEATYYVTAPRTHVYREENGCVGLQESSVDCDDDGELEPADNALTAGELTGLEPKVDVPSAPSIVCGAEDATIGGDDVCAAYFEAVAPVKLVACLALWVFAEEPMPPCGAIASFEADGDTYYLSGGPSGLYLESNGCEGLQYAPSDCDGDGDVEPADDSRTLGEITGL